MGAHIAHFKGRGPYVFKVHGQIYHTTCHMHPEDSNRLFAQLYVIDSSMANEQRLKHQANKALNPDVLQQLDSLIRQHNVYAHAYRMLREIEIEEENVQSDNHSIPVVHMAFKRDRNNDRRRYNSPTVDEIGMIFRSADGEPPFERDFRVYPRSPQPEQPLIHLNILSCHLDPMTYVLFFPYGEPGWQSNIEINIANRPHRKRTRITMLQWKVAQTAIRPNIFNPILHGGKLFQQWVVDSYLQVEANNLNFIRHNQGTLRVEQYRGLMDHLNDFSADKTISIGRAVILPSSFQGSPRNMREKYHDAMAIVARYGKPDLFITMTCNPKWKEIKKNLLPGQQACDRPDTVARVFSLKLKAFLDDIKRNNIFGRVVAFMYTIEFQKRGLPHGHFLFKLHKDDVLNSAEKIDQYICAEIPDKETFPELHAIVITTMIHGPCGVENPDAPCMVDGKCMKIFPKKFTEHTITDVNGYPLYRRREGVQVEVRNFKAGNNHVVPFNEYLTKKYSCHINVESCQSVKAIKYIFKYIYKGYDKASVEFNGLCENSEETHDEIRQYLDARYVSAPEAMWRLLENPMHDRSHAFYRLAIHLPDEHLVYFQEGQEDEAAQRAQTRKTHLTAWFILNQKDENARQHLYCDIPYHYVFDSKNTVWKTRQRGGEKIVSRMFSVSPKDTERFHLRLLLQHSKGAQSFNDLKVVNGVNHETFKAAAVDRGLVQDDSEWSRCLQEAATFNMAKQFREVFALICIFNSPRNPLQLYQDHLTSIVEDYARIYDEQMAESKALQDMEILFRLHGAKGSDFGLPEARIILDTEHVYNIEEEATKAECLIRSFNMKQKEIFNEIIAAVNDNNETSRFFFIDGPGGSGKTYLYNAIMSYLRGHGKRVESFATTGIAADLLIGGRTAHSGFKIPISAVETSVSSMKVPSKEASKLFEAAIIIIDEASMLSLHSLRVIDLLLKEIMTDDRPFGGKTLILGGDFRQTTIVVPNRGVTDIFEGCVKSSPLWQDVKQRSLEINMRTSGQDEFNQWVLKIGNGELSSGTDGLHQELIEIPSSLLDKNKNIIDSIFGSRIDVESEESVQLVAQKIILATKNDIVGELNSEILKLLDGDYHTYTSIDSIIEEDPSDTMDLPMELINEQCPSGMPPHELKLKVGAIVMLLRNLNAKKGLLNGTRLIVKAIRNNFIDAQVITGSSKGERVFLPRIILQPSEQSLPFKLSRQQFPVIPAFAMTINKAQGQSFDHVGVYLPEPVFAHGQLYVALTRVKNPDNLKVLIKESQYQGKLLCNEKTFTKNIVIKEILNK